SGIKKQSKSSQGLSFQFLTTFFSCFYKPTIAISCCSKNLVAVIKRRGPQFAPCSKRPRKKAKNSFIFLLFRQTLIHLIRVVPASQERDKNDDENYEAS